MPSDTILPIPFKNEKLNLLVVMAIVAAAFAILLPAGLQIHRIYPALSEDLLGVILGIGIPVVVLVITSVALRLPRRLWNRTRVPITSAQRQINADARRTMAAYREFRERRIAELDADPVRRKYAELMKHGQDWSEDQIAYDQNPNLTATCPHLKPIEHAMRMAGITARLQTKSWMENYAPLAVVEADCRVNQAELKRRFTLPDFVLYAEGFMPERSELDNPFARLICNECRSAIELVHPEWPRPSSQWFPAAP